MYYTCNCAYQYHFKGFYANSADTLNEEEGTGRALGLHPMPLYSVLPSQLSSEGFGQHSLSVWISHGSVFIF